MTKPHFALLAISAVFSISLAMAPATHAADSVSTTTTSTTTSAGTVSDITADGLVIRSGADTAPLRYSYSRTTTYVDESGAPVSVETLRSGVPVTVEYIREGDRMIARRVIVQRQAAATTAPTVIERNTTITRPPVVVEKPVIVEKKVYVDRPVEKKVYVDRPVIVEKPVIVKPAPATEIIEKKTTTTTTTTEGK